MNIYKVFSYLIPEASSLSNSEQLRSAVATFLVVSLLTLASGYTLEAESAPLLMASMGASAVILFSAYNSPLAQPWPFVGSHILSAAIGVTCAMWVEPLWMACSVSVTLSLWFMHRTHCFHPPGGATALIPVLGGDEIHKLGYQLLITPLLMNIVILLGLAILFNRGFLQRKYPYCPKQATANHHQLRNPLPLERTGVNQADVAQALEQFDGFLDISEGDLNKIYRMAQANAQKHYLANIYCRDLMSQDLVTIEPECTLERVWSLLQKHKIKAIPVVNETNNVVGIVTLIDFFKPLGIRPSGMSDYKRNLFSGGSIIRNLSFFSSSAGTVAEIMSRNVLTVEQNLHLLEIMPTLCDTELHHIPVIDDNECLVGMLTASDLLAALFVYAGNPPATKHRT